MGDPITVEKCEICRKPFNLPMKHYRRGGGWQTGDGTLVMYYKGDEVDDLSLDMVCPGCVSAITVAVEAEIEKLKKGAQ